MRGISPSRLSDVREVLPLSRARRCSIARPGGAVLTAAAEPLFVAPPPAACPGATDDVPAAGGASRTLRGQM